MSNTLEDGIKKFRGERRQYLLMRVAGMDKRQALAATGLTENNYNNFMHEEDFAAFNRQVDDLFTEFQKEAVTLLRRANQLRAVILESKMLATIEQEIETGEYVLSRTPLAKEVYTRLLNEMDIAPKAPETLNWFQRIDMLVEGTEQSRLEGGRNAIITEATESTEDTESTDIQDGQFTGETVDA
jgi:hypothetical protein